jgi:hypothetical protein
VSLSAALLPTRVSMSAALLPTRVSLSAALLPTRVSMSAALLPTRVSAARGDRPPLPRRVPCGGRVRPARQCAARAPAVGGATGGGPPSNPNARG